MKRKNGFVVLVLLLFVLSACGPSQTTQSNAKDHSKNTSSNKQKSNSQSKKKSQKKNSQKKQQNESSAIPESKWTPAEKVSVQFVKGYYDPNKATRQKAVDQYVNDEVKALFQLGVGLTPRHTIQSVKVMESVKETNKGVHFKMVLLHVGTKDGKLHEWISLVKDQRIEYLYSRNKMGKKNYKKYDQLRSKFKTPIPDEIKQQQKETSSK